MLRPRTRPKRALHELLLTRDFVGAHELRLQAEEVRTGGLSCDCGCASFSLRPDVSKAPSPVSERVPTEAHGTDPEGNRVGVLLFVDAGYLSEVEIVGFEGTPTGGLPLPASLTLSEWSAHDSSGTRHLLNRQPED